MGINYIAKIISKRDNISMNEALNLIEDCCDEIKAIITESPNEAYAYEEVAYTIQDMLGLEPDYLDELLNYIW